MPRARRRWEPYLQRRVVFEQLDLTNICGEWRPPEALLHHPQPGPVIHWLPRGEDIERLTRVAEAVAGDHDVPLVVEVAAGSGFLSYLLARTERLRVVALEPDSDVLLGTGRSGPSGRRRPPARGPSDGGDAGPAYSHNNLRLLAATCEEALPEFVSRPPDVVVCSWMPARFNLVPDILRLRPKAIVYMRRDFAFLESDDPGHLAYNRRFIPGRDFRQRGVWSTPSEGDVIDCLGHLFTWRNKPVIVLNDNLVEVQVQKHLAERISLDTFRASQAEKYPWEATTVQELAKKCLVPSAYAQLTEDPRCRGQLEFLREGLAALLKVPSVALTGQPHRPTLRT